MIIYREASSLDYKKIAELHLRSWQQHYRGNFSDHFLDVEAAMDRESVWENRLKNPRPDQYVLVAEQGDETCGFACVFLNEDATYGALLDNLHVAVPLKGRGIGKELIKLVAQEAYRKDPNTKMYLWVLEDNIKAIAFYERLGGINKETVVGNDIGDKEVLKCRMIWNNVKQLVEL